MASPLEYGLPASGPLFNEPMRIESVRQDGPEYTEGLHPDIMAHYVLANPLLGFPGCVGKRPDDDKYLTASNCREWGRWA